jgi:predicted lipid-binding transport protein (Tim44 family)
MMYSVEGYRKQLKELTLTKNILKIFTLIAALYFISAPIVEVNAYARAGGGRSFGSRGGGSFSRPSRSYSPPRTSTFNRSTPTQQQGGGFLRNMAGGLVGGVLGGMLFRSLGFGAGGAGGGGIGPFEILLLAGIGYFIYRMIKKRRMAETPSYTAYTEVPQTMDRLTSVSAGNQYDEADTNDVASGLAHIRQMDPNFDESRFSDAAMDIFFKIQGAWMHRELAPVTGLLTEEMKTYFQDDINSLFREKKINKLENIAVRTVEVVEAWQESGQDFITARIYANLLDYTTDDSTGAVISGSTSEPVKFEEYWTFTRPVGNNPWKLSSINQS